MKKTIINILLCVLIVFGLTACGSSARSYGKYDWTLIQYGNADGRNMSDSYSGAKYTFKNESNIEFSYEVSNPFGVPGKLPGSAGTHKGKGTVVGEVKDGYADGKKTGWIYDIDVIFDGDDKTYRFTVVEIENEYCVLQFDEFVSQYYFSISK